jgi:hypothetical protein
MQALAQHLGPTLYRAALVQALNTLHVKRIFGKDSPNKDLKLAEIKNLGSWESDEGTSASKNGSCQLSPSWSSCSASSCTRCRGSQSWTARGTCLNRKATNRINCFKMFQTCFKQFLASDLFRKCLTRAPQKWTKRQPRSIHASSWPCTRHECGPRSFAVNTIASVSGIEILIESWLAARLDETTWNNNMREENRPTCPKYVLHLNEFRIYISNDFPSTAGGKNYSDLQSRQAVRSAF